MKIIKKIFHFFISGHKSFNRKIWELTGVAPSNPIIFKVAFQHKSSANNKVAKMQSNERLEYLGDSILSTVVAEYLFQKYPYANEGFLTKMRSKIVQRRTLNNIANSMSLDYLLREFNHTRISPAMVGNALEALIGAVYLEKGYDGTKQFILTKMIKPYIDLDSLEKHDDNYKSRLLEYCQKENKEIEYKLLDRIKQNKRDRFKVAVIIDNESCGIAEEFNKKNAEQIASHKALIRMGVLEKQT